MVIKLGIFVVLHLLISGCGNEMNMSFEYEKGYSFDDFTTKVVNERYSIGEKNAKELKGALAALSLGVSRQDIIDSFGNPDLIVNFTTNVDGKMIETMAITYFVIWCEQCVDEQEENTLFIFYMDENGKLINVIGLGEFRNLTKGTYPGERGTRWSVM